MEDNTGQAADCRSPHCQPRNTNNDKSADTTANQVNLLAPRARDICASVAVQNKSKVKICSSISSVERVVYKVVLSVYSVSNNSCSMPPIDGRCKPVICGNYDLKLDDIAFATKKKNKRGSFCASLIAKINNLQNLEW